MPEYRHHKTYYIGCEDDGSQSELESSDLVYINSRGLYGWCDPLSKLSSAFMDAELRSKFTTNPSRISVIVSTLAFAKRKEEDPYECYERIEFIIENFVPPSNGAVITVYAVDYDDEREYLSTDPIDLEWPFQTNTVWRTKEQWRGSESDYITLQRTEGQSFTRTRNAVVEGHLIDSLESCGYDIVEVDYTMRPHETYEVMLDARFHVSYVGASWWLSHYMGVPVIDYGEHVHQTVSSSIFGVLGAPGMGKDRCQVLYDGEQFIERKMRPETSFGLELTERQVREGLARYVHSLSRSR